MPSVHEVLLEVTGNAQDARRVLAETARELAAFDGTDAEAELSIDTGRLQAELAAVRAELEALKDNGDVELRIRTDLAISQLHGLEQAVKQFRADTEQGIMPGGEDGDFLAMQHRMVAGLRSIQAEVAGIQKDAQRDVLDAARAQTQARIELERQLTADTQAEVRARASFEKAALEDRLTAERNADRELERLVTSRIDTALRATEQRKSTLLKIGVELDPQTIADVDAGLDDVEKRLRDVASSDDLDLELKLRAVNALNNIDLVRRRVKEMRDEANGNGGRVRGDLLSRLFGDVRGAISGADAVSDAIKKAAEEAARAAGEVAGFGSAVTKLFGDMSNPGAIASFAGKTRDVQEAVQAVAIAMVAALIPALIAVGASFTAAIAGAGALATSFAFALGPAVALLVALFERFAKIIAARKAQEQELKTATNQAANEQIKAAAAERARAEAARALRDAQQGVVSAERAVAKARADAVQAIERAARADADASRATKRALEDVKRAEDDVADARIAAKERIRDAIQKEREAEERLARARIDALRAAQDASERIADAQADVKAAVRDAYEEWERRIQQVRDDQLALQDASLNLADAQLDVESAQLRVNEALAATPELAQEVFSVLERLRDVDFGPDMLGSLTQQIGAIGGSNPTRDTIALQEALIALAKAKIGVQKATLDQSRAENKLNDDQRAAAQFAKDGLAASDRYRNAVDALADAQRDAARSAQDSARAIADATRAESEAHRDAARLQREGIEGAKGVVDAERRVVDARQAAADAQRRQAETHREYLELQRQGVAGAEGVISAEERLRDAHERVAAAAERLRTAGREAFDRIPAAATNAKLALDELSGSELAFLDTLNRAIDTFERLMRPATDLLFGALSQAFTILQPLIDSLGGIFEGIAQQWADAITSGARSLVAPAWQSAMSEIFAGTTQITGPVLDGLGSLFEVLRNIAVATMPFLVELVRDAADWLGKLAGKTGDIDGLRETIAPLVDAFRAWMDLFGGVGDALLAFSEVVGPIGSELVRMFADAARELAEWMRSEDGRKRIKEFFDRTLPLAVDLVGSIWQLGQALGGIWAIVAPFLAPFFDGVKALLDVFNALVNIVLAFLEPLGIIDSDVASSTTSIEAFTKAAEVLADGLNWVAAGIRIVMGLLKSVYNAIVKPFKDAVAWVLNFLGIASPSRKFRSIGQAIVDGVKNGLSSLLKTLTAPFRAAINAVVGLLKGLITTARNLGASVIRGMADGFTGALGFLKRAASTIVDAVTSVFGGLAGGIQSAFKGVVNVIVTVLNAAIDAVNFVINAINKIPNINTPFGNIGIPDIPEISKIPKLATGGIATRRTFAELAEAGTREAILPLTNAVLGDLAAQISKHMIPVPGTRVPALAGQVAGGDGGSVEQHFHIVAPAGAQPDPRTTAAQLSRLLRKKPGGGVAR